MSILDINKLALELVARDFSDGHSASNGGPTKTSRALAIIHLAARDAYAKVTGDYAARLGGLPEPPVGLPTTEASGKEAVLGAGRQAAVILYPDFSAYIHEQTAAAAGTPAFVYGVEIANRWLASRLNDGSSLPQMDAEYKPEPGHHRADPVSKSQTLGRNWGQVVPFVLNNVELDARLGAPPKLTDEEYGTSFDDVAVNGRNNIKQRSAEFQHKAALGIFWGYDGSNKLGTPPRLYNQIVVKTQEFMDLAHKDKVNVLAAINAAMADAGIAAWYWKYKYDFWRPVVAIREAEKGWGPTGKGDGNTDRIEKGNPFWLPLGAPRSNPFQGPKVGADGDNFTPNFPAYPSGHATFGTACFKTFAGMVNKSTADITVSFTSDEFNGATTDNEGIKRPEWEQTFTLQAAIEQNSVSRIYLGVHWDFDAKGGEKVGRAIADKTVEAFKL